MAAEAYVRVPDDAATEHWLESGRDHHDPNALTLVAGCEDTLPSPIGDLLILSFRLGFTWYWEPERRLLSHGDSDLQVNYGLGDDFAALAIALREAEWGYHFESAGKYELVGECWEWMPGWPAERVFVCTAGAKALDHACLDDALADAARLGVDPVEHLRALLDEWPGFHDPDSPG